MADQFAFTCEFLEEMPQGFEGARWMKMTDPSAAEAPSTVGSFLIWQQPHLIYMAELIYRRSETINPPFELSYWHYGMTVAQLWRERCGQQRDPQWDELIDKLSPLACNADCSIPF